VIRRFFVNKEWVVLSRGLRAHSGAKIALVFGTPILTVEVDEDGSIGNGELSFEDEDMVLCSIVCDFMGDGCITARLTPLL